MQKNAYKRSDPRLFEQKLRTILEDDYYNNANRAIVIAWSNEGEPMLDIWKFSENYVDKSSGALADIKVYAGLLEVDNIGRASSNTLIILGFEEKAHRMDLDKDIKDLPSGFIIEESFFVG